MDRPRPDRFNDRPAGRFNDRPGDGGGRHSRWSDGPPRYPRGGGEGFSAGSGGGRHHPYRDSSQDSPGGGPAFRDGPGGGPAFRDGPGGGPAFRDGPGGGPAFRDGPGGGPGFRDAPGGGPGFRDGPGDGPGFRDGSGRGTGFHDAPSGGPGFPDAPGGGPGFRDGPGGGPGFRDVPGGGTGFHGVPGGFGQEMPMGGGFKRSFHGRGGGSPDYTDWSKFVKLFVGSVPRTATEEEIRPLFEEQGDVVEVALIKDKRTGQQQGCCFIKYATSEEADRAIKALHNQYTLPGGTGPIQVRYADGERENHGTVEHKLFVASLNREATEKEIEEIFSPYGHVEDVYLMRDEVKQSRGSGFVKFSSREMAAAALNALHGTFVMRGCDQPLIVRFANPKRPRPGESRGGPAFGGPGFGPRSEASPLMRPITHGGDQTAGSMFPNAWNQNSTQLLGPPSQGSNNGFHTQSAPKDIAASSAASGIAGVIGGPTTAPSPSQQSFNPSMVQVQPAVGQQTSTLQKPLVSPPDLLNSSQLHYNQHMLTPQLHGQNLQTPLQQPGQHQGQQSIGLPPFGQSVTSQQFPGGGLQISAPQTLIQHNGSAPANALLQAPLGLQHQGMPPVANPQQLSSSTISHQLFQQPIQQLPSQLPQVMLQQQAQALQSSFQSSQQAILQLQQQLQQMQQSSQQQGSQTVKQQMPSVWTEQQPTSSVSSGAPAATVTSTASVTPAHPVTASVPLSCNWTEHTSPEGYKYYYNSATCESKWEKPEELTVFEQQQQQQKLLLLQQQQQKLAVQQLQSSSQSLPQGHIQPSQQLPQSQNVQAQMQSRQQAQLQILQPSLEYQASGVTGNQNIQGSYYSHLQAANSVSDPNRAQPGIQPTQEWAWQNKPTGS